MTPFNYNPTITGKVIKTKSEQIEKFFYQGHPLFLIPDFCPYPEDIWLSYLDFLEKNHSCEIYDQDGGEIDMSSIQVDESTGLTKCVYTAYGIMLDENDEPQDPDVEIEGYIVEVPPHTEFNENSFEQYIFIATKVFESYKFSI